MNKHGNYNMYLNERLYKSMNTYEIHVSSVTGAVLNVRPQLQVGMAARDCEGEFRDVVSISGLSAGRDVTSRGSRDRC